MRLLLPCLLFVALTLFIATTAQAQLRTASQAATAEQRLIEDIGTDRLPASVLLQPGAGSRNISMLSQLGANNNATIDQRSPLVSTLNQAYIIQVGSANVLGLKQEGNGNRADFTQNGQGNSSAIFQKGNNNKLDGLVDGNRNRVDIYQDGNDNKVNSEIREDGRKYTIIQQGNRHTLTQLETSSQISGYKVEMRGNGINLVIEQGKVR